MKLPNLLDITLYTCRFVLFPERIQADYSITRATGLHGTDQPGSKNSKFFSNDVYLIEDPLNVQLNTKGKTIDYRRETKDLLPVNHSSYNGNIIGQIKELSAAVNEVHCKKRVLQ